MEAKIKQHTFRLSESLHSWLKIRAKKNNRSMGSEVLQLLGEKRSFEEDKEIDKAIDKAFGEFPKG